MGIAMACLCGRRFDVPESYAGKSVRCPGCKKPLSVPDDEPEPVAAIRARAVDRGDDEPASYGLVRGIAVAYLAVAGLGLVAALAMDPGGPGTWTAVGAFASACIVAPWSFLAVDVARTLRGVLREIRERK